MVKVRLRDWGVIKVYCGHILSSSPGVIGCFGSQARHPHPGDPGRGDQSPVLCPYNFRGILFPRVLLVGYFKFI